MSDADSQGGSRTFTEGEIAELADGLRRTLAAIEKGDLVADSGTVARLEGAVAALDALVAGAQPET